MQWIYGVSTIVLSLALIALLSKGIYLHTKTKYLKTYVVSIPLAFVAAMTLLAMLHFLSSRKRFAEVDRFVTVNGPKLMEVVESPHGSEGVTRILVNLNVRLVKGGEHTYHFELYQFLGYGYRVLYTENLDAIKPESPGKSPTYRWHRINKNWYYYSYLD